MGLSLIRNWWAIGLVGALAVIVGVMTFFTPLSTLSSLVLAMGIYALVSGITLVVAGIRNEEVRVDTRMGTTVDASRGWLMVTGVITTLAGLAILFWPGLSAVTLYTVTAVWAIMAGITQVIAAIVHRDRLDHTWLVALGGVAMAAFGVYLLAVPAAGVLTLAYAFGVYAIAYGASMLAASAMLKRAHDHAEVTISRVEERAGVRDEIMHR